MTPEGSDPRHTFLARSSVVFGAIVSMCACQADERAEPSMSDRPAHSDGGFDASPEAGGPHADAGPDAQAADASSPLDDAGSTPVGTPCWPYDRPSIEVLRAAPRKVFAHYFSPYPISIDNKPADIDYYTTGYLDPNGEGGIHAAYGGLLRERPLPQTPWSIDYALENAKLEVARAVAIGLDGFTYDLLSTDPASVHRLRLDDLLEAIPLVDATFKIQLVFDMSSAAFGRTESDAYALNAIMTILDAYADDPAIQRTDDGKIVASAFAAELRSAEFWKGVLEEATTAGHELAFIPMPVGSWPGNAAHFDGVSLYGATSWGTRTSSGAQSLEGVAALAHGQGLIWMAPVAPQDSRPKNQLYTESDNSLAFRAQWQAAIEHDADWVQVITWNDYSEDSEIAPSSKIENVFYDLSGYYITWFKRAAQPVIERDVLYLIHRAHSMDPEVAAPDTMKQSTPFVLAAGSTPSSDRIEVLAFLTGAGRLEIEIGGQVQGQDVAAGIQSLRVPLAPGTPRARLIRKGQTIVELESHTTISNAIVYQDPLYHATSSLTCVVAGQ